MAGGQSGMFWEFARILAQMGEQRPRAVLLENVHGFATSHGFEVAYDPLHPGGPFTSSAEESPATDDRPFFFDTVPLSAVLSGRADLPYGYGILFSALVLALAACGAGEPPPLAPSSPMPIADPRPPSSPRSGGPSRATPSSRS